MTRSSRLFFFLQMRDRELCGLGGTDAAVLPDGNPYDDQAGA